MTAAVPARPSAWTLRPGHPDLCPGVGQPCLYEPCYRHTTCTVCGRGAPADHTPSVPGGGTVGHHYPTTGPRAVSPPLAGQLDLFDLQEATA